MQVFSYNRSKFLCIRCEGEVAIKLLFWLTSQKQNAYYSRKINKWKARRPSIDEWELNIKLTSIFTRSDMYENGSMGLSGCWTTHLLKSTLSFLIRAGVPVFSLDKRKLSLSNVCARATAARSPIRPASCVSFPTFITARKNVPVVKTTVFPCTVRPSSSTTPLHRCVFVEVFDLTSLLRSKSSTPASKTCRFGVECMISWIFVL